MGGPETTCSSWEALLTGAESSLASCRPPVCQSRRCQCPPPCSAPPSCCFGGSADCGPELQPPLGFLLFCFSPWFLWSRRTSPGQPEVWGFRRAACQSCPSNSLAKVAFCLAQHSSFGPVEEVVCTPNSLLSRLWCHLCSPHWYTPGSRREGDQGSESGARHLGHTSGSAAPRFLPGNLTKCPKLCVPQRPHL